MSIRTQKFLLNIDMTSIILKPKAYFKRREDFFLNSCVKNYTHVFDHTIKPIQKYGDELQGSFYILSQHVFVIIQLITMKYILRFSVKNLFLSNSNFAEFIKGVNFAVYAELGRFSPGFNIISQMLEYWHRLKNPCQSFPTFASCKQLVQISSILKTKITS